MNRRLVLCSLMLLLLFSGRGMAQGYEPDKVWVQGGSVTFTTTFNGTAPPDNQIISKYNRLYFTAGGSNICDSAGNLLLISDGYNLYDKNLNFIDGGDTLVPKALYDHYDGWSGVPQSSIILPFPGNKYRLITPTASDSEFINHWNANSKHAWLDLLLYDEIDMNANGGAGKVTKRMVPLLKDVKLCKTEMMACKAGDGVSWWLLKQAQDTNIVYSFLIAPDSIYGPYVQGFAEPHFTELDIDGQSMFSRDGTKYAATVAAAKKVFVADFDRCSGKLSNPKVIDVPPSPYFDPYFNNMADSFSCGLSFSPNGRLLYVNGFWSVRQLDLQDSNPNTKWTILYGPDTAWQEFQLYSNIYPGLDGKLYVGNRGGLGGQMSVINNPDSKGLACGFCPKCLRFPGFLYQSVTTFSGVQTPPCMPNYHLGATNPICYPTGVSEPSTKVDFRLYPNPSSDAFTIESSVPGQLRLYEVTGRLMDAFELRGQGIANTVSIAHLPAGIYTYMFVSKGMQTIAGKVVVDR